MRKTAATSKTSPAVRSNRARPRRRRHRISRKRAAGDHTIAHGLSRFTHNPRRDPDSKNQHDQISQADLPAATTDIRKFTPGRCGHQLPKAVSPRPNYDKCNKNGGDEKAPLAESMTTTPGPTVTRALRRKRIVDRHGGTPWASPTFVVPSRELRGGTQTAHSCTEFTEKRSRGWRYPGGVSHCSRRCSCSLRQPSHSRVIPSASSSRIFVGAGRDRPGFR